MIVDLGKYYLYRHVRLDTNEPFYIGVGTNNEKSENFKRSRVKTNRNAYWKNIVSKTDYKVEILLQSDNYEFILNKEIEFISLYGRKDLNKGSLTNLTNGGEYFLGYTPTIEVIEKRRKKMIGRVTSEETKEKLRIAHKGITHSQKTIESFKKKVKQYDLKGNLIKLWDSLADAGRSLKIPTTHISKNCRGINYRVKSFVFRYENDNFGKYKLKKSNKKDGKLFRI